MKNISERIFEKIIPEPNTGCILWYGNSDKNGYGKIYYSGRHRRVHAVVYEIKFGSIPYGNLIQHKCDTPSCCNIDHLELGTPLSNMQDKVKKGRLRNQHSDKSHCKRGHAWTKENTMPKKSSSKNIVRRCRACAYLKNNESAQRRRLATRWPVLA